MKRLGFFNIILFLIMSWHFIVLLFLLFTFLISGNVCNDLEYHSYCHYMVALKKANRPQQVGPIK
jgi:hypothetical protein